MEAPPLRHCFLWQADACDLLLYKDWWKPRVWGGNGFTGETATSSSLMCQLVFPDTGQLRQMHYFLSTSLPVWHSALDSCAVSLWLHLKSVTWATHSSSRFIDLGTRKSVAMNPEPLFYFSKMQLDSQGFGPKLRWAWRDKPASQASRLIGFLLKMFGFKPVENYYHYQGALGRILFSPTFHFM